MTSANNQIITRCPKCGTAFRVTPSQLQSAKGAVRCGSCLNVFKAQEYLVTTPSSTLAPTTSTTRIAAVTKPIEPAKAPLPAINSPSQKPVTAAPRPSVSKPATPVQSNILSAIKPLPTPSPAVKAATPQTKKNVVRVIDKSSLAQADDILISDDMDDGKAESKSYDSDDFMDIDMALKSDVSLFERKIRNKDMKEESDKGTDESWAEMLIEDEDDDTPQLAVLKPKTDEQLADDELFASHAVNTEQESASLPAPTTPVATSTPGLMFSLIGEKEEQSDHQTPNDFVLSDELARMPSNQGFSPSGRTDTPDPTLFETPEENADDGAPKRQLKTQPKIRAYDGSRTALLMNIIPAPIEFSAKRMRRWYQRKLWPSVSILALIALIIQVGWFKFDYFSRAEPYRTGYLFLCPYLGCQVPTLVDTSRIVASNLVVREHPDTEGALAVDVMLINSAPFEQPFPDLVLVFTDIDEKQVASRRFIPKDYLGGELVGQELMPQNQKIHITLDLVDPGTEAVNYHISIPRQ